MQRWLERAGAERLDRVDWSDHSSRPRHNRRTAPELEDLILELREQLRTESALGEYGAAAIARALTELAARGELPVAVPTVRTIGRILERRGALDGRRRIRRPPPPPGWYLPDVAAARVELDSIDAIVGLKIRGGREIEVLTAVSLHGGRSDAWPTFGVTARHTMDALTARWRRDGVPAYAQFDNDTRFHGPHGLADRLGRVTQFCLRLGVVPVFTPPYETGFQAMVEAFNGRWQAKVWQRFGFVTLELLRAHSSAYVEAASAKLAERIDRAPARRPFPAPWELVALGRQPRVIYLRRTNDAGAIRLFGRWFTVDAHWPYRLVRAEFDLRASLVRCYALRRRDPTDQPLLAELAIDVPLTSRY